MDKAYTRIRWENGQNTALGATNLNRIDVALDNIDNRVIAMDATKLNVETANGMVSSFLMDTNTGIITVTLLDGTVQTYDLNLEKIPVSISMDADAMLHLKTEDGEEYTADLKTLIDTYIFEDSDTVATQNTSDADGKHIAISVKKGSLTGEYLNPDYLASLQLSANEAQIAANVAVRYAVGGIEEGDAEDNAKYYKEKAEVAAQLAEFGKLLLNPRGAYIEGTTYQIRDAVSYQGSSYVALKETISVPSTDNADWFVLAERADPVVTFSATVPTSLPDGHICIIYQ